MPTTKYGYYIYASRSAKGNFPYDGFLTLTTDKNTKHPEIIRWTCGKTFEDVRKSLKFVLGLENVTSDEDREKLKQYANNIYNSAKMRDTYGIQEFGIATVDDNEIRLEAVR